MGLRIGSGPIAFVAALRFTISQSQPGRFNVGSVLTGVHDPEFFRKVSVAPECDVCRVRFGFGLVVPVPMFPFALSKLCIEK